MDPQTTSSIPSVPSPIPVTPSPIPVPPISENNTSGQGKASVLPPELKGWNWGAFGMSWIWGIGNQTYLAFLTFIPWFGFIWIFVLGLRGNEWAWRNKHWDSIEHFKRVQRRWTRVWLCLIGFAIVLIISAGVVAFKLTEAPVIAANVFLNEINSGQIEAAYNSTSAEFKNIGTVDQFKSLIGRNPIFTQMKSTSFSGRSIVNSDATLKGTIYSKDGKSSPITIVETETNGIWSVSRFGLQ